MFSIPNNRAWFQRSTLTQIASKLDEHMSVLVEGLNTSLVSCAKLRSRRWCLWEDMGQWNQEELVISGLIHNLPSRLYIDPIQSGETLNVNWFVWDRYEFYGLSKFGETSVASKIQSIILILMLGKCQLIWNCHVLVWLYNSNGCLPTYRFSEFSTLGETQATDLTPRPVSFERSHPSVEIQFSHEQFNLA